MIRRLLSIAFLIALVGGIAYFGFDGVHNYANRAMCKGGTVSYKENYNNYHPGLVNKILDSNSGRSELDPQMYILHVDDGSFLCSGKDQDFAVSKPTFDKYEIGDTYKG